MRENKESPDLDIPADEKNPAGPSLTFPEILRFGITWLAIGGLWEVFNVCPDHGTHMGSYGHVTALFIGFLGACFFTIIRVLSRRGKAKKHEDAEN